MTMEKRVLFQLTHISSTQSVIRIQLEKSYYEVLGLGIGIGLPWPHSYTRYLLFRLKGDLSSKQLVKDYA